MSPPSPSPPSPGVLFATGFRPFFLLAATCGLVAPLAWVALLTGHAVPLGALPAVHWHVHEMVLGFAGAVVAGFLLTAVQNWTGERTAGGPALALLAALWVVARVHGVVDLGFVGTALDLAFFPALALAIARPLWRTGNRRNALFPPLLLVLAGADLGLHMGADPRWLGPVAIDAVAIMLVLVGGRIVPLFTRNALGVQPTRRPWLDHLSTWSVGGVLVGDLLGLPGLGLLLLSGAANLARLAGWRGLHTRHAPILWVLHLGYLWTALGLGARGVAHLGGMPASAAVHLLAVGGIGTLSLGMMARVALGHTGRRLVAPAPMGLAFLAVSASALARALWSTQPHPWLLWASAGALSASFAIYLARYTGILVTPRADGRPG